MKIIRNGFACWRGVYSCAGAPLHPDAKPTGEKDDGVLATGGEQHQHRGEMGVK